MKIDLIPKPEFDRIYNSSLQQKDKLLLIADMCRVNTLSVIKRAGSGHLGSSFSSMDIMVALFYSVMNIRKLGVDNKDRDIFFSSKGHDAPAFYSVLYSLGILPEDQFINLRRLDGVCGHPDIKTPGVEANTGSLGMGISKAKGIAMAKKLSGNEGRVFILTGDGEFQEGQIYEALQTAYHQKSGNINVIIDHNKVQSDKEVAEICALLNLESKINSFGWDVKRIDGHNPDEIIKEFSGIPDTDEVPGLLIADTIKGKGVSFMEHTYDVEKNNGIYKWHSGAPDDESFQKGFDELKLRINKKLESESLEKLSFTDITPQLSVATGNVTESLTESFGKQLLKMGGDNKKIVVLDCDLASDCGIRDFEEKFPERFVENGIAEQDMVSMAGGLALQGMIPVVNSFGAFLASRANEQIYNNATEKTKIVYVCHYAGLFPAGPGYSHQSVRDISLLKSLPEIEVVQPCNAKETAMVVKYCIEEAEGPSMIRLFLGKTPEKIILPDDYRFKKGYGAVLKKGEDCALFAYGPVMVSEALKTSEVLSAKGIKAEVINMPWLNSLNTGWLASVLEKIKHIYVIEDHAPSGSLAEELNNVREELHDISIKQFAVRGLPAWGTKAEVLKYHGLDAESMAEIIASDLKL